jgi:hypothetical protein
VPGALAERPAAVAPSPPASLPVALQPAAVTATGTAAAHGGALSGRELPHVARAAHGLGKAHVQDAGCVSVPRPRRAGELACSSLGDARRVQGP